MRRFSDDDEGLKNLIYPLRVNSTIGQLLLLKLMEINDAAEKARTEIERQRPSNSRKVNLETLPTNDRLDLLKMRQLKLELETLERKLRDRYQTYTITDSTVDISLTDQERARENDEWSEKYNAMTQETDTRYANLRDMARKMVDAHIKQVKSKIPQNLVDELQQV